MTRRGIVPPALAACLSLGLLASCILGGYDFDRSPPASCKPGATERCSTTGAGHCLDGARACGADGTWSSCSNAPRSEDCPTPTDKNGDGKPLCGFETRWAKRWTLPGEQAIEGVATDEAGNVYLVGHATGSLDFGGTPACDADAMAVAGFVVKTDPSGNVLWSRCFDSSSGDAVSGVALGSAGDVFVTGFLGDTADFGEGRSAGKPGLTTAFVAALEPAGNTRWVGAWGEGDGTTAYGQRVAPLPGGGVAVAGTFGGTIRFTSPLLSSQGTAPFVAALGPDGNVLWGTSYGSGADTCWVAGLGATCDGQLWVTGTFAGEVRFDGPLQSTAGATVSSQDVFVAKLDASGTPLLSKSYGDGADQRAVASALDREGNLLLAGEFGGVLAFGGGMTIGSMSGVNIFVAKLDPNGGPIWAKGFGNPSYSGATGVATDDRGNVVVTGYFINQTNFGGIEVQTHGLRDLFMLKLSPVGDTIWVGSYPADATGYVTATTDPIGNVALAATMQGGVSFDGGAPPDGGSMDMDVIAAELMP